MSRTVISDRRMHQVLSLSLHGQRYYVGFGYEFGGDRVLEVFADGRKSGSDAQAQLSDACIAISLLLQHGIRLEALASAFGEVRNEGEAEGPPASILGLIAREGLRLERSLQTPELTLVPKKDPPA